MSDLYVVGIGPGKHEGMTIEASEALNRSVYIVGYPAYLDLVKADYPDKKYFSTPMKQELERCKEALRLAAEGENVSMICSGDAGVYGMASPILQLAAEYESIDIHVIPGVSAALSGAAVLGAPLAHDFCVISLSDLLTPYEVIEKRLRGAALGDFCIALYNPSSHKRADYLKKACDILLEQKSPETICGIVRNIGRDGEEKKICTLEALRDFSVDMFTTVFIGNKETYEENGFMITPRGYKVD